MLYFISVFNWRIRFNINLELDDSIFSAICCTNQSVIYELFPVIRECFQSCFLENDLLIVVGEMIMKDLYALRKGGYNVTNFGKALAKQQPTCDYLESVSFYIDIAV